jgi:hypothetical protein
MLGLVQACPEHPARGGFHVGNAVSLHDNARVSADGWILGTSPRMTVGGWGALRAAGDSVSLLNDALCVGVRKIDLTSMARIEGRN